MQSSVYQSQAVLRASYKEVPERAKVTNEVFTGAVDVADPFHSRALPAGVEGAAIPVAAHAAVGGPYDAPCPGDLLCAALAACQDSSVRMVANLMGIELVSLEVRVRGTLDVRGAMGIQPDVPIGYQSFTSDVQLQAAEGTPPHLLEKLRVAAERCCVVAQTLRCPPPLETTFHFGGFGPKS